MKKAKRTNMWLGITFIVVFQLLSNLSHQALAQGLSSYIGDRENIGIFGGPATDLSYSNSNQRIFAAVSTPFSLFYSDDTCHSWTPAFPADSMEFDLGNRGWGGGASRVIANQVGWVAAQTGNAAAGLSSVAISYNGGSFFQTAFDPSILQIIAGEKRDVTAMAISDHFCFVGLGPYLARTNPTTTLDPAQLLVRVDTIAGLSADSYINWIAASNSSSGYPLYFVVKNTSQQGRLFKFDGNIVFEPGGLPFNEQFINVFTHPIHTGGDTLFVSAIDTINQEIKVYRSYSGGLAFINISPPLSLFSPLSDVDYSSEWAINQPAGDGLRLSFPGGMLSDDLGQNWQMPSAQLGSYGIATDPYDLTRIIGSNYHGVLKGTQGIGGPFSAAENIGFASVDVVDFDVQGGDYYVATRSGLAYTSKYFDPSIVGYEQWIAPNGMFPVPNAGNNQGVSCVAIDPTNPNHVICGSTDGFSVSSSGPADFTQITPPDWNTGQHIDNMVTDIAFITSNTIIAVSGQKFTQLDPGPPQLIGNIWKSTDGGYSWELKTPFGFNEFLYGNCIAVSTDGTQPLIYVGTGYSDPQTPPTDGALWMSDNFGDTWQFVGDSPMSPLGTPLPIYDLDIDPNNNLLLYACAGNLLARSDNGGLNWFNADIPHNLGIVSSALIDLQFPDSITFTVGRNIMKYNFLIDDADLKFKGLPGEFFSSSSRGSVLGGSNTGVSKIVEAPTYMLNIKMFIEGPFNGTDMNTDLNTLNLLPLNQPFNQAPWYYSGTESVSSIPNDDIVDWVLLDLRKTNGNPSSADASTRFDRKAVFLLKDGTLVDDDGFSEPRFSIILNNYKSKGSDKVHGVVYAPGHVEERTADSLSQAKAIAGTFSYDFTTGSNQAYGGKTAHKELAPGIWGMISGDGNQDARVDNRDKNDVWLVQLGSTGYYNGDFNRDGTVDQIDLDDYWKPNAGHGVLAK